MCEYCNQKKDGGVELLEGVISLGDMGKIEVGLVFWNFSEKFKPHLDVYAWGERDEGSGECLFEISKDIEYCPWCGRRLCGGDKPKPEIVEIAKLAGEYIRQITPEKVAEGIASRNLAESLSSWRMDFEIDLQDKLLEFQEERNGEE